MRKYRGLFFLSLCACLLWFWGACGPAQKKKGEACTQNEECAEGLKCLGSKCNDGQKGSSCAKDKDCTSGLKCIAKSCKEDPGGTEPTTETGDEPEPTADAGQPDTRTEPSAPEPGPPDTRPEAQPEPQREAPPEPRTESAPDTILGANCRSHSECTNGQMCLISKDRITATCSPKPKSCKSDGDCTTAGTHCRLVALPGGTQVETLCVYPFDNGKTLNKVGEVCKDSGDCQSGVCLRSAVCGAFCKEDKDCQSQSQFYCGTYTYFQRGEFGGCYPRCKAEADCPDGYQCDSNSKCVPKDAKKIGSACRSKSDCPANGECLNNWNNGYCLSACTPSTRECGTGGKVCNANEDCREDVDNPGRKICVPQCSTGNVCALFGGGQGYCLKACTADKDCRKDYYCAAVNDATLKACLPRGTRKLGEVCEANGNCESGVCRLFPSGRYCSQRCDSTACPSGYSCNTFDADKLCEKVCVKDSSCPEGYKCIAQQCVIPPTAANRGIGEACTKDSQCKAGKCVNNAGLFPHGYCTQSCGQQQTCPNGSLCINYGGALGSLCTKNCQADTSCNRKDLFCFFVRLSGQTGGTISCGNAAPCPNNPNFPVICKAALDGSFCTTGICLGRGTRPAGQACTTAFQCRSGNCYQQPAPSGGKPCNVITEATDCGGATPKCHPTALVCVPCVSNSDCGSGLSCVNNRCTTGGYCVDDCANGASCPANTKTKCTAVFNKKAEKVGDMCVPECRSSLQCQGDFLCKQEQGNKVCLLP